MQQSRVAIECKVDGEFVHVRSGTLGRSKLVASLAAAGSVGNIEMPFDSTSVMAWQGFAEGYQERHTFQQCVAALKVLLMALA